MTVRNKNTKENMRHSNSWPDRAVTVKVRVDPVSRAYTIIPAILENSLLRVPTKTISESDPRQGVQRVKGVSGLNNECDTDCVSRNQKKQRCAKENTTRSLKEEEEKNEFVAASLCNQAEPKESKWSSITYSLEKENTLARQTEKSNDPLQEVAINRTGSGPSEGVSPAKIYNQTSTSKCPYPEENRHSWNDLPTILEGKKQNVSRVKSLPNNFREATKTSVRVKLEEKSIHGSFVNFEADSHSKKTITGVFKSDSNQEIQIFDESTIVFEKCSNPE